MKKTNIKIDDKAAKQEAAIIKLRLMGYGWQEIEKKTKVPRSTAHDIFNRTMAKQAKQESKQEISLYLAEELNRIDLLIKELWEQWEKSKRGGMGNYKYILTIKDFMSERNKLKQVYDRVSDDNDAIEMVRFEQNIYIPGLGAVTPEMMQVLIANFETKHASS